MVSEENIRESIHCDKQTKQAYFLGMQDFAELLKENPDVYTGECSCRKAISLDRIFELLKIATTEN